MDLRFYQCKVCGKVIAVLSDTDIPTFCCGQEMQELIANQTDGTAEKHVPVFSVFDHTVPVRIGSMPHPMNEKHHIEWIGLRTDQGFRFKELHPCSYAETDFFLDPGERAKAVYAFCNLHGLWCAENKI